MELLKSMELVIRNTVYITKKEIENKKFNIFIPISLGNKWFTEENLEKYILWGLKYTKNKLLIVIGDSLHQINVEVKDHYSPQKAKRKVEKVSSNIIMKLKDIIDKIPPRDSIKITVISWRDLELDKDYQLNKSKIYSLFEKNILFRNQVMNIVNESVKGMKNRKFTDLELLKLSQYVLNELPIFLQGINYGDYLYLLHPYPVFTKVNGLVNEIYLGNYPEISKNLKKPYGSIVELS